MSLHQPDILKTTTTAAVHDPVTKKHLMQLTELERHRKKQQQEKFIQKQQQEEEDRKQRHQQQPHSSSGLTTTTSAAGGGGYKFDDYHQRNSRKLNHEEEEEEEGERLRLATKVTKSVLEESSLILNPYFLGNVAAQYTAPAPPPFTPVIVEKRKRKKKHKKNQEEEETNTAASGSSGGAESEGASSSSSVPSSARISLPVLSNTSLPSLEVAAPARNLCIELLSTRIVACVRAVSLLLQEFSSSPGQSLPHVAVLGTGNVGNTILTHLVKLLPADRIVVLARDEKSEVCNHFSHKYGIRCLSTNILRDEKLIQVIKNHRQKQQQTAAAAAASAATDILQHQHHHQQQQQQSGGGGGNAASHVSPEVAAAHNVSVALQQVHILIVACRPAQLNEVASSLQPWLRSSAVTILSTLVGVTADRVASLFRVPSSLSVTVDTNEMLFAFESASLLNARNAAAASILDTKAGGGGSNSSSSGGGGASSPGGSLHFAGNSMNAAAASIGAMISSDAQNQLFGGGSQNKKKKDKSLENQKMKLRFFTREPLDFVHRFFFALVSTLLERCGVGPVDAWLGVARLMLGRRVAQAPPGLGTVGPLLVQKCNAQCLAQASGLTIGEVMRIVDARMAKFAGVQEES